MQVQLGDLPWQQEVIKPLKTRKPVRALPAGRMRSVKFGDILKSYKRKDNFQSDHFVMIDFRPAKPGDHFLDNRFNVARFDDGMGSYGPRIILELVRGNKKGLDNDEPLEYGRVEIRRDQP